AWSRGVGGSRLVGVNNHPRSVLGNFIPSRLRHWNCRGDDADHLGDRCPLYIFRKPLCPPKSWLGTCLWAREPDVRSVHCLPNGIRGGTLHAQSDLDSSLMELSIESLYRRNQ